MGERKIIPYKCRSWRHEGECRLWRGAQDFTRIEEAMAKHSEWSHITLTYYQRGRSLSSKLFRDGVRCWAKMRKRIAYDHGPFKYIQTWEVTRKLWPHVHLAISNKDLFSNRGDDYKLAFDKTLGSMAVDCGFGREGWLKPLVDAESFAGYLCKLAKELTGGGKDYQVPVNAPKNFRRLRASVGLLPPAHKDPDITGILLKYPIVQEAQLPEVPL